MPPRPSRRASAVHKASSYMSREAARRLRLAKKAADSILRAGGSRADAAAAAQAYGAFRHLYQPALTAPLCSSVLFR